MRKTFEEWYAENEAFIKSYEGDNKYILNTCWNHAKTCAFEELLYDKCYPSKSLPEHKEVRKSHE